MNADVVFILRGGRQSVLNAGDLVDSDESLEDVGVVDDLEHGVGEVTADRLVVHVSSSGDERLVEVLGS